MNRINRNSYERYIIDYLEGALSPDLRSEFSAFLLANPDIADELDGLDSITVKPDSTTFQPKISLKRADYSASGLNDELQYLLVAEMENDLSSVEKERLSYLEREEAGIARERALFAKTKLCPETVSFPNRSRLYRRSIVPERTGLIRILSAVAAAVTLLLVAFFLGDRLLSEGEIIAYDTTDSVPKPILVPVESRTVSPTIASVRSESGSYEKQQNALRNRTAKRNVVDELAPNRQTVHTAFKLSYIKRQDPKLIFILKVKPEPMLIKRSAVFRRQTCFASNKEAARTREYTLADLALLGLKKGASAVGVEVKEKPIPQSKAKKIVLNTRLIAFSKTIRKK